MEKQKKAEDWKAARRAYYKEWRQKNPDKIKATRERFFSRMADRKKEEAEKEGTAS